LGPLHPPEALQAAALVELHVSMDAPPTPMVDGAARIDALGRNEMLGEFDPPQAASNSARTQT
jgi:hypothetical protein